LSLAALIPGIPGGRVFHGGKKKIGEINQSLLQSRDYGFFGKGFYVADEPWMTKGYGGKVSGFDVYDNANVLHAASTPDKAKDLAKKVRDWYYETAFVAAKKRGKLADLAEEANMILTDPAAFHNAVDRYAEATGVDIVKYSPGEIVVKNPSVLRGK
jgi:hypothetical protein